MCCRRRRRRRWMFGKGGFFLILVWICLHFSHPVTVLISSLDNNYHATSTATMALAMDPRYDKHASIDSSRSWRETEWTMTSGPNKTNLRGLTITTKTQSDHGRPRRLFLGIFTDPRHDVTFRKIIRTTYLSQRYLPYGAPTICSLSSFSSSSSNGTVVVEEEETTTDPCQVVYAFVADQGLSSVDQDDDDGTEIDMIMLPSNDTLNQVQRFYHYLRLHHVHEDRLVVEGLTGTPWDFIAFTHSRVILFPDRVWPQTLFKKHGHDGENIKDSSPFDQPFVYSGSVFGSKHSSRIETYVSCSQQLWYRIMNHPLFLSNRSQQDKPDTFVASIVKAIIKDSSIHKEEKVITWPLLDSAGVCADASSLDNHDPIDCILQWDDYKDAHLGATYMDPYEEATVRSNTQIYPLTTCRHGPRILLGIMTMKEHDQEVRRRAMIRDTYLSYYYNSTYDEGERYRICSLHDLLVLSKDNPNATKYAMLLRECQLAYVFMAGGNQTGPTERVVYKSSEPITLPSNETDVVLLNIKENMNEGKTPSFFKYATTVVDEHVYFDYIAKTDSDTLIFPDRILNDSVNKLPVFPNNVLVYGGYRPVARKDDQMKGPLYWQGSFYFLSVDLARYITSAACDRQSLTLWSEDKSMGNFVHSHSQPIHRIRLNLTRKPIDHPLKGRQKFLRRWQESLTDP
jgi:Galactosyltransferase